MKWAVAEGGMKTLSRLLQKFVGIASRSLAGVLLATLVIGVIQMFSGLIGSPLVHQRSVLASAGQVFGGVCFGIFASAMTVLGVLSFTYPGADVGITTFIVTMWIIPGAFIDWAFFQRPLNARQWVGVGVFLLAGYAMLNFPSLDILLALPPWVWFTLGIAFLAAVNEGISQGLRKMDPLVNNFWVGLTTVVCAALGLTAVGGWGITWRLNQNFWIGSVAIGAIVVCMISFKLMAYRGGGSIALKKLIMWATYLVSATVLGWLFYTEPLTVGKFVGMAGYLVAFTLIDKGTWEFVSRQYPRRVVVAR